MQQPHATFLAEFNNGDEMKTTAEDIVVAYKAAQDVALAKLAPLISVTSALIFLLQSPSSSFHPSFNCYTWCAHPEQADLQSQARQCQSLLCAPLRLSYHCREV
ncbi:hypothetical protein PS1_038032 [Malus domestica]